MNDDRTQVSAMVRELITCLDHCYDVSCELDKAVAQAGLDQFPDRSESLASALDGAIAVADSMLSLDYNDIAAARDSGLVGILDTALVDARVLWPGDPTIRADIEYARHLALTIFSRAGALRPNSIAGVLVRYAAQMVPVVHRFRYDEEFRADLTEVASGVGRWAQLGYASRVLVRGFSLRWALRGVAHEQVES